MLLVPLIQSEVLSAMPHPRLIPLLLLALPACYAEFDVPRCERATDCPVGYTTCYDSYCLAMPLPGVAKAALPQVTFDAGVADVGAVMEPKVVWTMDPVWPGGAITAEPASVDDVLYIPVQATGGALVAVSGGDVVFTEALAGASPRCPMVVGEHVVVPHDGGVSWVARAVGQGEDRTPFAWSSPEDPPVVGCAAALPGGQVFVALSGGQVVLLVDGVEKARSKLDPPPSSILSISLVSKSVLAVATGTSSMILLDAQSLEEGETLEVGTVTSDLAVWKDQVLLFTDVDGVTWLRLATTDGGVFLQPPLEVPSSPSGHLVLVNGERAAASFVDGTVRRFKVGPKISLASSVAVGSPSLVTPVVVDDGALLVLDAGAGKLNALDTKGDPLFDPLSLDSGKLDGAGVVMAGDLAVVYSGDGRLFAARLPGVTGLSESAPWPKNRGGAANLGAAPAARVSQTRPAAR